MRHLRIYRAIRTILREGSIRKAAEILTISPSALNRAILSFEDELGVEIFERLPGGVRLSVAGELLFRHLDEHLSRMDDFVSLVSEMRSGVAGELRLSVSRDLTEGLLPQILARYRAAHPGIRINIEESEGPDLLSARRVDLALVTWPETNKGCEVLHSHQARVVGRVGPAYPFAGQSLSLADLSDHVLILPPEGSGLRVAVDLALRRSRATPRTVLVYPRLLPDLATAPLPEVQPVLNWRSTVPDGYVDLAPLRIAPVQITLMRRSDGILAKPAEQFHATLHRYFDQPE
ncbi:LysR family transcriptional regulator [Nioella aestuarii]|uniref:LysR substrate-binding domain-containing protein n=1 Tax=Nioella aestuarii TaxID=1662864 RepID=UPI003D7FB14C